MFVCVVFCVDLGCLERHVGHKVEGNCVPSCHFVMKVPFQRLCCVCFSFVEFYNSKNNLKEIELKTAFKNQRRTLFSSKR